MNDIKIEKTMGGYKAEANGFTRYSPGGVVWMDSRGNVLDNASALRDAFIQQFIDPPKEQPAPLFKVGDRVVCVDARGFEDTGRIKVGNTYVVLRLNDTFIYFKTNDDSEGGYKAHRFTLATEPKVYSGGDLASLEDGVYLQTEDPYPYLLFVYEDISVVMVTSKAAPWCNAYTSDIDEDDTFIRIANSISDIFIDGILEMEAL